MNLACFFLLLPFLLLSKREEEEKENELSRNSLVFSSLLFSKRKPGRGGGKGHFSFDACGCEGHRRALGYCTKIVIYSDYLNKTAYFRTKIIKYCLKNSTKKNAFSCVYFT